MTNTMKAIIKFHEAQLEVTKLWSLMCQEDGVSDSSMFVVFNSANKYFAEYQEAMGRLQHLRKLARQRNNRAARHAAYTSCGLARVRGNLGGTYYE